MKNLNTGQLIAATEIVKTSLMIAAATRQSAKDDEDKGGCDCGR